MLLPTLARPVRAQRAPDSGAGEPRAATLGESRRVDGLVRRGTAEGPRPVGGLRVTLHRVGPDRAGPLDSSRTDAGGRYTFRYRTSGSQDAVYFVSVSYDGIAYFTSPLREPVVSGDDAAITVFDTTSGPVPIHVAGRHLIVAGPNPDGARQVAEVYELGNDSSLTVVSRDTVTPVWSAALPRGATEVRANPSGEISPAAIRFRGGRVLLFAPLSPGIRQLSFGYLLPADAFPLAVPMERPTAVLEVLTEEPGAKVSGAGLAEVAPVTAEGRPFKRFLAQNVPPVAAVRLDFVASVDATRTRWFAAVAATLATAMLAALALVLLRRRERRLAPAPASELANQAPPEVAERDALLHAIATLDAEFARVAAPDPESRARYETERRALKERLAALLAATEAPE